MFSSLFEKIKKLKFARTNDQKRMLGNIRSIVDFDHENFFLKEKPRISRNFDIIDDLWPTFFKRKPHCLVSAGRETKKTGFSLLSRLVCTTCFFFSKATLFWIYWKNNTCLRQSWKIDSVIVACLRVWFSSLDFSDPWAF